MLRSVDPVDGSSIADYPALSLDQVDKILEKSEAAFQAYSLSPLPERVQLLRNAAKLLRKRKGAFAQLMIRETGKPVAQAEAEVEKCAWVCEYYADNAAAFLADECIPTDAASSYVAFRPLGVILAVMPWNFPLWQVFRFAAPNLAAGNCGVLKHASNVSGCAMAIEKLFADAGFPDNVFRTLLIGSDKVSYVIANPVVKAVTLTGSTPAGKAVASAAGVHLKKTVLELGGSDPYIVLDDADLELAAGSCVNSRLINNGQSCIAAKRFIVVDAVYKQFLEMFIELMKAKKVGDPFDRLVDLGPLARADLRDELHEQVMASVDKGAKLLLGGTIPEGKGAFYPPTVLAGVKPGMVAFDEELFGPVAAIIKAKDTEEAIALANRSMFGLGAAVFTSDAARGEQIARNRLQAGCCFVNAFVRSDPRLPFGGINQSGYGRELSLFGIREFLNIKTVYIK